MDTIPPIIKNTNPLMMPTVALYIPFDERLAMMFPADSIAPMLANIAPEVELTIIYL